MEKSVISKPLSTTLFFVTFGFFLYVANLVVYEALAGILQVTRAHELIFLGAFLGVFSLGFIAASIVGMRFYNLFTRLFYTITALWIGLFTYLFLASVVYGLLIMIDARVVDTRIGMTLIMSALAVSVYGVFHARQIKIVKAAVTLPNLPDAWKGRGAIWISDVHLGQLYGSSFAEEIVKRVNALPHDIVFIGGDLYDGTGASDINALVAPLGKFSGKLGIYFITGNHEEIGDSSAFVKAVRSANITPLLDEKIEIEGMQIIGVDYRSASRAENFEAILAGLAIPSHMPSILLKHEPKDLDVAHDAGISFQISGHTHRGQLWPFGYIASLIYKNFAYGMKRFKNMHVYTSSGVGTWGPPMRVGTDCEIVHITFN